MLNDGIFAVPLDAKPIAVFEFVQVYVAPEGLDAKTFDDATTPGQKIKSGSVNIIGKGLIVIP